MVANVLKSKILILTVSLFLMSVSVSGGAAESQGKKIGQEEFRSLLKNYIFASYKDKSGVHIESALSALGALSGFALQSGIREEFVKKQGKPENKVFTIVEAKNGEKYYFGAIFDQPLYDTRPGKMSVWALVGGGALKAGVKTLPNINELAKSNAAAIGSKSYGKLTVQDKHQPRELPVEAIKKHWKMTKDLLDSTGSNPLVWGWQIALVAQDVIVSGKDVIEPGLAARIVMEPAISMSKIDPNTILKD